MEESPSSTILDGQIIGVRFGLATRQEILKSSNSGCPINHPSQLSNTFLGLPLPADGKCDSCGTAEPGQCEGHFGYIELPIPIYHPDHVGELKRMLSLLCLKCLKMRNRKFQVKKVGVLERIMSCCEDASQVSINEEKTTDGASYLELKAPGRKNLPENFWGFLDRYGFRYGYDHCRPLLPSEVMEILRKIPQDTRKKLSSKGYFPQEGYILQYLPVPPNCLSVPDVSDGNSFSSSDHSIALLKKVLKQVENIKSSRSGTPNFESHEVEANELQACVAQYFQFRGCGKASRDVDTRFGVHKELNNSSTKAWLEKMKTLFIRKASGFSSRSVITGDPYKGVNEIGLPFEIAQKITFEERVNQHNIKYLQKLVDEKLCLTYKDGLSTYSLREGTKGHTFLRPGQVVHRRIMDGDIVFINRPPTTHKHSLQALSVYIHDDHAVKINPLICGPLSADFDGDCIHLFYPQSLAAKAEVVELFSVEKQLLSSHTGNFNLQLAADALLSLKFMIRKFFFSKAATQQLAMFAPDLLPRPALTKCHEAGPIWTALQILQATLPECFDSYGERHLICKSEVLRLDYNRDMMQSILSDIVTSIFFAKGPKKVLGFFNSLQPLLMENLDREGCSIGLEDLFIPRAIVDNLARSIQDISPLLSHLRSTYNELVDLQVENHLRVVKMQVINFVLKSSVIGHLIDSKSESALNKVVQQIGFLGVQIADRGKFYSRYLASEMATLFHKKYPFPNYFPVEEFGLVSGCLFYGLDPYQEMVHSISSREVIVRSSRGLTEPGTLFKNLMAILRDVVICHDGTVRNVCSNSIIQFEYGIQTGTMFPSEFGAGDPVGVLAATAMSNPAYKAVLDSSPSSNSSWDMMKEILLSGVSFKNDISDRRVILYLNNCGCGRKYCRETAACIVKNQLSKVSLKDAAKEFLIEYRSAHAMQENSDNDASLVGHIHLNKALLQEKNINMQEVLKKCEQTINSFKKRKKIGFLFRRVAVSYSECCSFQQSLDSMWPNAPCLNFFWQDTRDDHLDRTSHILAETICPVLLETIIQGDPRVSVANIIWINPETMTWIRSPYKSEKGELAVDVILEKEAVQQSGDAWRVVMDCCLPVMHLIDTGRSIPYAIKQVQELLGISCAFEQAVQRLSTSVSMVTKGVLKDHLVLLANSMTCAGNLIGFNMGGIKALSRSLNVQVPFTEATLYTPRKCFERAAEKRHVDSLSSVVASCSWGKHVAVGTGCTFDILWDTRMAQLDQKDGVDVYSYLNLLRSNSDEEERVTSCLGAEIDDLQLEDEYMDFPLSPPRDSDVDKPTFDDGAEFQNMESQNNCEPLGSSSPWPASVSQDENDWGKKDEQDTWFAATRQKASTHDPSDSSFGWGRTVHKEDVSLPGSVGYDETDGKKDNEDTWIAATTQKSSTHEPSDSSFGWGRSVEKEDVSVPGSVSYSENDWKKDNEGTWIAATRRKSSTRELSDSSSAWGRTVDTEDASLPEGGWNRQVAEDVPHGWGKSDSKKALHQPGTWSSSGEDMEDTEKGPEKSGKGSASIEQSSWSQKGNEDCLLTSSATVNWGKTAPGDSPRSPAGEGLQPSLTLGGWGKQVSEANETSGEPLEGQAGPLASSAGASGESPSLHDNPWEGNRDDEAPSLKSSTAWGSKSRLSASAGELGWQSPKVGDSLEDDAKQEWGERKHSSKKGDAMETSRGWGSSNAGEWKKKRNQVSKSVDHSTAAIIFTVTRQRLDTFTAEEQEILLEVEPIMQNIRKIMHQKGYNDADHLTAEDQSYIVDYVLNYHPEKAAKIGAGIDHITIGRHTSFQDTRCFYIVSTDGRKEDFSSRKCIENLIKEKYPGKAEAFLAKYFKKPQPRPGWSRDRGRTPEGGSGTPRGGRHGTPAWNRNLSNTADEAGTPAMERGNTPAWNREWDRTPDEVVTPNVERGHTPGWNREWDSGPGEAGTPSMGGDNHNPEEAVNDPWK